jgi:hypothetical protein
MWTTVKRTLARWLVRWRTWRRVLGKRSGLLRNVFAFLILVVAYAIRTRAERSRWDARLRRQTDAGNG